MAILLFIPLFFLGKQLPELVSYKALLSPLDAIVSSWSNFCFMIVLVSTIVVLNDKGILRNLFLFFAPLGKMSLTNYMMQSIIGSCLYYGFGFGLYQYTGATVCLLIGLALAIFQQWFCRWWLRSHDKGVLEGLWHRLTWGRE
jgi:uncharacterized protein